MILPDETIVYPGHGKSTRRTDCHCPTGNREEIMDSIINKLLLLPNDTIIYPGNGLSTKIKDEKSIYL